MTFFVSILSNLSYPDRKDSEMRHGSMRRLKTFWVVSVKKYRLEFPYDQKQTR
jgi:hypothetical protein